MPVSDDRGVEKCINDFSVSQKLHDQHKQSLLNLTLSYLDGELFGNKVKYFIAFVQFGITTD